jgi:hypothetical protein
MILLLRLNNESGIAQSKIFFPAIPLECKFHKRGLKGLHCFGIDMHEIFASFDIGNGFHQPPYVIGRGEQIHGFLYRLQIGAGFRVGYDFHGRIIVPILGQCQWRL